MLRSTHESMMALMEANLEARKALVDALNGAMVGKDNQIEQLTQLLTSKNVIITPKKDAREAKTPKMSIEIVPGRSGWRKRSEMLADKTIPAPNDSFKALEQRVEKEGGKV
jgi:hypothetical protein